MAIPLVPSRELDQKLQKLLMALDHYISQVHLKRFYSPTLGELMYAMRKNDLEQFTPRAKDVCRLDEGSTNKYLTEPRAIEEFLKTIEGKYNEAASAFEEGTPTPETIYVAAGFVSYILTCSPAAMRINSVPIKGAVELTAKLMDSMPDTPAPPESLGGKDFVELLDSGKVKIEVDPKYPQAIGIAGILQKVARFGNFHWEVLINEHNDCSYFTSDFPVGNEPAADPRVLNRIIPLTPTTAVRIEPDIGLDRDRANFDFGNFSLSRRKVTRNEAVRINRLLVRSAENTVFFRDLQPWVAKFIEKNRHFRVNTESIQIPHNGGTLLWSGQVVSEFNRD